MGARGFTYREQLRGRQLFPLCYGQQDSGVTPTSRCSLSAELVP